MPKLLTISDRYDPDSFYYQVLIDEDKEREQIAAITKLCEDNGLESTVRTLSHPDDAIKWLSTFEPSTA